MWSIVTFAAIWEILVLVLVWTSEIVDVLDLGIRNGKERKEHTSSGYRSASELRGMCSVRANVFIPRAIAVWIISSRESFAWPGQNCPE